MGERKAKITSCLPNFWGTINDYKIWINVIRTHENGSMHPTFYKESFLILVHPGHIR